MKTPLKIVLLDTGRGVNPDTIRMWRENLELEEHDEVAIMAWQPPREPLPVTEHYVFGPRLNLRNTEPRHVQTVGELFGGHDIDAAQLATDAAREDERDAAHPQSEDEDPDIAEIGSDDSPVSESDLAGQMTEAVSEDGHEWISAEYGNDKTGSTENGDEGSSVEGKPAAKTPTTPDPVSQSARRSPTNPAHHKVAGLPVYHPQRLAHAVRWRGAKAIRMGRNTARTAKRRGKHALKVGNNPVAQAAQRAIATRNGSIATQFAVALARSEEAAALFAGADLVFPVDARSQRGAWLLARANTGPDVIVGYPAAIRALEKRRALTSG